MEEAKIMYEKLEESVVFFKIRLRTRPHVESWQTKTNKLWTLHMLKIFQRNIMTMHERCSKIIFTGLIKRSIYTDCISGVRVKKRLNF